MKAKKIRILGIAPYNGMKNSMKAIADERGNLDLDIFVGDLDMGAMLAKQHLSENYDVIISRGGTAEKIKKITEIPVIEIPISIYDILRAIKLAENYGDSYTIVGFSSITSTAHLLCDLLQYQIDIVTIHNEKDVQTILADLKQKNCPMILCDVITNTMAKQIGLRSILITSGKESIQIAFEQAVTFCKGYSFLLQKSEILSEALRAQTADTIILEATGAVFFSTCQPEKSECILAYLKELIKSGEKESFSKSFHLIGTALYAISLKYLQTENIDLYLFVIEPNPVPAGSSKYGLRFANYTEMQNQYYNSFYSLTSTASAMFDTIKQINACSRPVMILGEQGTGKDQAAARLYIESNQKNNPFIIIDCRLLNDKNWEFLIHHYNSPLCDNDNTIYISNIQALSSLQQKQLLSLMIDTNLSKRNRMILSCSLTLKQQTKDMDPSRDFIDYLPCITLFLPPLRELKEELLSSSSLYLNTLNMDLSRQVVGFEPEAFTQLLSYHWPQNFMQLKRVLTELVMLTSTPYIKADTVKNVLEKEHQQFSSSVFLKDISEMSDSFDYNRSLDEIIRDVIHIVLRQNNGNQSKTAKKLGISRTTLWRYLK